MPMPVKVDPDRRCQHCGTPMQRKRLKGGRLEDRSAFLRRKFCDRNCMGNAQLSDDPTATFMRKFRKACCEKCGTESQLGVHHKDEDRTNNSPDNLQTLCAKCHALHHWATGKRQPRRQGTCGVCERPARKQGFCETHHSRFRRHGSPFLVKKRTGSSWQLMEDRG